MSHQAPFTIHIKVVPYRRKRFEMIRDLQRIAKVIYDAALDESDLALARPGGGQASNFDNGMAYYADGLAVKPQFGESPAQLMITGFYAISTNNVSPVPERQLIHAGSYVTGPGDIAAHANPVSSVATEVAALKAIFDDLIADNVEAAAAVEVFRLDYKGVTWGDRGYTFP